MKIVRNTGGIQETAENENRDANLAQLASMVDSCAFWPMCPLRTRPQTRRA